MIEIRLDGEPVACAAGQADGLRVAERLAIQNPGPGYATLDLWRVRPGHRDEHLTAWHRAGRTWFRGLPGDGPRFYR